MNLFEMINAFVQRILAQRKAPPRAPQAVEAKVAPNRMFAGTYSEDEIQKGRAREITRAIGLADQSAKANRRYRDLEEKMGMRPGIDGSRPSFRSKPF